MPVTMRLVHIHGGSIYTASAGYLTAFGATESEAFDNLGAKLARLGYHMKPLEG